MTNTSLADELERLAAAAKTPGPEAHWVGYETREQMWLNIKLNENLPTIIAALRESNNGQA